jgi:CHASE3 domain
MTAARQPEQRDPRAVGRAWADLPLRSKGLVVVATPLLATALFGVAMAQDRRAQTAVRHTMEVEREIAQLRILVQAGVTGYVLTGERQYLASYEEARRELPEAVAHLEHLVRDNPGQADRVREIRSLTDQRERSWPRWWPTSRRTGRRGAGPSCSTATSRSPTR